LGCGPTTGFLRHRRLRERRCASARVEKMCGLRATALICVVERVLRATVATDPPAPAARVGYCCSHHPRRLDAPTRVPVRAVRATADPGAAGGAAAAPRGPDAGWQPALGALGRSGHRAGSPGRGGPYR